MSKNLDIMNIYKKKIPRIYMQRVKYLDYIIKEYEVLENENNFI